MSDLPINQIVCGDAISTLKGLSAGSVQCVITSPPYWGLRDYGIEPSQWPSVTFVPVAGLPEMTIQGCEPDCEHVWAKFLRKGQSGGMASAKVQIKGKENFQIVADNEQAYCQKCGGWRRWRTCRCSRRRRKIKGCLM